MSNSIMKCEVKCHFTREVSYLNQMTAALLCSPLSAQVLSLYKATI